MHTKLFAFTASLLAIPAVTLMAIVAIDPSYPIEFHTGYLFTWTALGSIVMVGVTMVSAIVDAAS